MVLHQVHRGSRSSSLVFWNPMNQPFHVTSAACHVETVVKSPFPPLNTARNTMGSEYTRIRSKMHRKYITNTSQIHGRPKYMWNTREMRVKYIRIQYRIQCILADPRRLVVWLQVREWWCGAIWRVSLTLKGWAWLLKFALPSFLGLHPSNS